MKQVATRGGGRMLAACLAVIVAVALAGSEAWTRSKPAVTTGPVSRFIGTLRLAEPRTSGGLTILPVCSSPAFQGTVRTLAESLASRALRVEEIGEGRVNELYVENLGPDPIFVMAGQILVGAKQNRILQHDVLLPAKSGRVAVQAFCVQQGRWHYEGGDKTFSRSENVSNPQVRAAANQQKEQGRVWGAVARTQSSVGVSSETGNLDETYNRPEVQGRVKQVRSDLAGLPDSVKDMQGAVAIVNGRVLAVDVFGQRRVLKNLWAPLLASYALEAVKASSRSASAHDLAIAFLEKGRSARLTRLPNPGMGMLYELTGAGLSGSALVVDESVLHLELFPMSHVEASPSTRGLPNEPPIQRNYPR